MHTLPAVGSGGVSKTDAFQHLLGAAQVHARLTTPQTDGTPAIPAGTLPTNESTPPAGTRATRRGKRVKQV